MNLITRYKKTAMLATIVAAISMSSVISAGPGCSACAAAAAIRQSIRDAQAAALAGGKKTLEEELDEIDAQDAHEAVDRAAREELVDPCFPCTSCEGECSLNCKLQTLFNCCVCTNREVRKQAHEAKKCCKRLRHEINEIEDTVEDSFSVVETLIIEDISVSEACCSVIDSNLSVIESLIISQTDASAACCSVIDVDLSVIESTTSIIDTNIGDPAVQIASLQDCSIDVLDFVNTNNDDVMTWLKRLYVLMYQVFSCTCCD
jgi:hypothetical protein